MEDSGRRRNNRLIVGGAFAVGVAAAVIIVVAAGVLFFDVDLFSGSEETRTTTPEPRTAPTEATPKPEAIPEGVQLVGILASPRIVQLSALGETLELAVQRYYSDSSVGALPGDSRDRPTFASSDETVVRVSSGGLVTGRVSGGADVSISYGGFSATVLVLVWGEAASIPAIDPDSLLPVDSTGGAIVLNRIIVELEAGNGAAEARQVADAIGGEVIFEFGAFPGFLIELETFGEDELEEAFAALEADRRVVQAYSDLLIPPSDAGDVETLRISPEYGAAYLQAGMEEAWERMATLGPLNADPVVMVVMDSGFTEPPVETSAVGELLEREFDYKRISIIDGIIGDNPNARHGTSVTRLLVAQNNPEDSGIPPESFSGVVSNIDSLEYFVILYEVGEGENGSQSLSGIINSLGEMSAYAGILDVVNFSTSVVCSEYGRGSGTDSCGWVDLWSRFISAMSGVTFVTAAGNSSRDIGDSDRNSRVIPAAFSLELENVITAGGIQGVTPRGRSSGWVYDRAQDSNFGDAVTVGAPYDVWAMDIEDSDGYAHRSGPSYSATMVSGAVALLRALEPQLAPSQIKEILTVTGTITRVCDSNRSHPGDICPGEEEEWRRLNAGAAVRELLRRAVRANIDLTLTENPAQAALNSAVDLEIPVKSEGAYPWKFHMDATVCAPSGEGFEYQLPLAQVIGSGSIGLFPLSFEANEPGTWRVDVGAYRDSAEVDPQRSSSLDEEDLHIFIQGAAGATATPTPNSTASPRGAAATPAGTASPEPTVAGTTSPTPGAPTGATAIKCVSQQEGTAGGFLGIDANVVLVADTSGSMDGVKITELKETILTFISLVDDPSEYIALIDFDDNVEEAIALESFSATENLWDAAVARLDSDGGTSLYGGVS